MKKKLTALDAEVVRASIAKIDPSDPEVAHAEEDAIRELVLEAIAGGARNAKELAAEALKTKDIRFSRWYA